MTRLKPFPAVILALALATGAVGAQEVFQVVDGGNVGVGTASVIRVDQARGQTVLVTASHVVADAGLPAFGGVRLSNDGSVAVIASRAEKLCTRWDPAHVCDRGVDVGIIVIDTVLDVEPLRLQMLPYDVSAEYRGFEAGRRVPDWTGPARFELRRDRLENGSLKPLALPFLTSTLGLPPGMSGAPLVDSRTRGVIGFGSFRERLPGGLRTKGYFTSARGASYRLIRALEPTDLICRMARRLARNEQLASVETWVIDATALDVIQLLDELGPLRELDRCDLGSPVASCDALDAAQLASIQMIRDHIDDKRFGSRVDRSEICPGPYDLDYQDFVAARTVARSSYNEARAWSADPEFVSHARSQLLTAEEKLRSEVLDQFDDGWSRDDARLILASSYLETGRLQVQMDDLEGAEVSFSLSLVLSDGLSGRAAAGVRNGAAGDLGIVLIREDESDLGRGLLESAKRRGYAPAWLEAELQAVPVTGPLPTVDGDLLPRVANQIDALRAVLGPGGGRDG